MPAAPLRLMDSGRSSVIVLLVGDRIAIAFAIYWIRDLALPSFAMSLNP